MMVAKDLNEMASHSFQDEGELLPQAPELPRLKIRESTFLSKKAGSFSGVPQRTVQSWSEKGFLIPEGRDTTGTGKRRRYSVINCIEIGVLKALARKRLGDQAIRETMEFLRKFREHALSGMAAFLHLYISHGSGDMKRTFFLYDKPELPIDHAGAGLHIEYLNSCDEVLSINVGKIVRKVLAEIET